MKNSDINEEKIGILYSSFSCSENLFNELFGKSEIKPGQAVQKYNRLIMEGIAADYRVEVNALTEVPITEESYRDRFFKKRKEKINKINYLYITAINIHKLKDILAILFSFIDSINLLKQYEKKVVLSDVLNAPVALGSYFAAKITGTEYIAILTDLPEYGGSGKLYKIASNYVLKHSDKYIFITEEMNRLMNTHNKPYLVIEGLVDCADTDNIIVEKNNKRIVLYTGSIMKKYGINNLIHGFINSNIENAELHIYGDGDYINELSKICIENGKVKYFGHILSSEIPNKQREAALLVNPRPTKDEYTKYSFPSKNMEYMVSGTPVLTTNLPGMPEDYKKYVYIIEDESADGISKVLKKILLYTDEELNKKGASARDFVLKEKNKYVQGKRIIDNLIL